MRPRSRPSRAGALAVVALGLGAYALWKRHVGYALDWPLTWLVAMGSGVTALGAGASAVLGLRMLWRGPEDERERRRGMAVGALVASVGLGCATYGLRGATDSLNPFFTTPGAVSVLPSGEDRVVFLVPTDHASPLYVADVRSHGLHRWEPSQTLAGHQEYVEALWWSRESSRFILRGSHVGTNGTEEDALTLDGAFNPLRSRRGDEPCDGRCVLASGGGELACVKLRMPPSGPTDVETCRSPLDASRAPEVTVWSVPLTERGVATASPDGHSVYVTDRCPREEHGDHCLYGAAWDGSARALLGSMGGNGCSIAVAPGGSAVYVVARDTSYDSACTGLWRFDVGSHAAPVRVLQVTEDHPMQFDGIRSVVFSPDGTRIAFLSDHEEGCAGSEGISVCQQKLYSAGADGRGLVRVSDQAFAGATLAWMR